MALRNQRAVENALLNFLALFPGPVVSKDVYEPLADQFELTGEERTRQLSNRTGRAWDNLVQWARNALVQRGLLDNSVRGQWSLTAKGRDAARTQVADVGGMTLPATNVDSDEPFDAAEGERVLRTHLTSERSQTLIDEFKARLRGNLSCQACGFDFETTYGLIGAGYIEAHHTLPVAAMSAGSTTRVTDLVALCANCHRIIHRNGLMSVDALKAILQRKN